MFSFKKILGLGNLSWAKSRLSTTFPCTNFVTQKEHTLMPNEETIQKISIAEPIQVNLSIPNFEGKPGKDGVNGRDGDDAYRIAVRNGFLGTEKEWLATLQGKSATATLSRQALLNNNVWCEDDSVDSVLNALIGNWGKPLPRTDVKPMAVAPVMTGQRDVSISGEPHYTVKLQGFDISAEIGADGTAALQLPQPLDMDDYIVEYYNYANTKVSEFVIQGMQIPDNIGEHYERDGIKYTYIEASKSLLVSVADFTGEYVSSPIFLGKWQPSEVQRVLVNVSRPTVISVNSGSAFATMGSIPVSVDHPERLTIKNNYLSRTPIMLGSQENGPKPTVFTMDTIVWNVAEKAFVNAGGPVDAL